MTSQPAIPATEAIGPQFRDLDAWPPATSLAAMWEGQLAAVAAVKPALPAIEAAASAAASRLARGGRLVYAGAGTSGRIGVQDGAELPPTFDWPADRLVLLMAGGDAAFTRSIENAEDDEPAGQRAIIANAIAADDVVIGIAASGSTPFTVACIAEAKRHGALTIAVINSPGRLGEVAEHVLLVETAPEVIAGSTRMKAGTAQKVVLNLFSSLVMVMLGRVHAGLMVDMLARNDKLRRRAARMLQALTGRDDAAIAQALETAGGSVKLAVLVLEGLDREGAEELLLKSNNRLRTALASLRV